MDLMAAREAPGRARERRIAWVVGGMRVQTTTTGASTTAPVEDLATARAMPREPLTRLRAEYGELTSTLDLRLSVRRHDPQVGGSFGDPQRLPAGQVRLGNFLCHPQPRGAYQWLVVVEVAVTTLPTPIYRVETDEESILVNGFLAWTTPAPPASRLR
jgi:hypothetical protein